MHITFTSLAEADIPELDQWHADVELQRRYGGRDWPRTLLAMIRNDSQRKCWLAWKAGQRVAYVDFEIAPAKRIGHIGLVVNPALRGTGYGKQVLQAVLRLPEVRSLREIRAGIEADNIPSIRCFKAVGFQQIDQEPDHEGCLNFVYDNERT